MKFKAEGITCSSCAEDMEKILSEKEGFVEVHVRYAEDMITVRYDEEKIDRKQVYTSVRKLGFPVKILSES